VELHDIDPTVEGAVLDHGMPEVLNTVFHVNPYQMPGTSCFNPIAVFGRGYAVLLEDKNSGKKRYRMPFVL
jgi:hypothetical protein